MSKLGLAVAVIGLSAVTLNPAVLGAQRGGGGAAAADNGPFGALR